MQQKFEFYQHKFRLRDTSPETIKKLKKSKKYQDFIWQWKQQKRCEKTLKVRKMTQKEMQKYLSKDQIKKLYSLKSLEQA